MIVPTNIAGAVHAGERVLPAAGAAIGDAVIDALPAVNLGSRSIDELFTTGAPRIQELLPDYLSQQRWFPGKSHVIDGVQLRGVTPVRDASGVQGHTAMLEVAYRDASPGRYAHSLTARPIGEAGAGADLLSPVARVSAAEGEFVLYDAMGDTRFVRALVGTIQDQATSRGTNAVLEAHGGEALTKAFPDTNRLEVVLPKQNSSNTNVFVTDPVTGRAAMLKEARQHPGEPAPAIDVIKGAFLTNEAKYANTPAVYGWADHVATESEPRTVFTLMDFAEHDSDAWAHALKDLDGTLQAARNGDAAASEAAIERYASVIADTHGRRVGELHAAFASGGADSPFRPVAPTGDMVADAGRALRGTADETIQRLRDSGTALPAGGTVDDLASRMSSRLDELAARRGDGPRPDRIHTHGDLHLGQLLSKGDDVLVIDLEGAPGLPLAQRWKPTDALSDVARQVSSYEYAAEQSLRAAAANGATEAELAVLRPIAERWASRAGEAFVDSWRTSTQGRSFAPTAADLPAAMNEAAIANALYETTYELGSRPDWASIPLGRLQRLANGGAG